MKQFQVGIQLYGVRNSLAADFEGTLAALRDMGYTHVELAGYHGKSAEEIRSILDRLGLRCVSVHQTPDFFDADADAACTFLKTLGVKYSVIPWYTVELLTGDARETTLAYFRTLADTLAAHGLLLGYHNHDFEFIQDGGKTLYDYIFDAVDEDKIIPEIDTCWVRYAGRSPVELIERFSGRVPVVHLKDFVGAPQDTPVYDLIDTNGAVPKAATERPSSFAFCPLGEGVQDISAILDACERCGTELVIVEQDRTYHGMTELEAARRSREYLNNTFGL